MSCGGFSVMQLWCAHEQSRYSPSVVLWVEEEVGGDDGDTYCDHHHDEKHKQHEPKHVVDLVLPEWREDEVSAHITEDEGNTWQEKERGEGQKGYNVMGIQTSKAQNLDIIYIIMHTVIELYFVNYVNLILNDSIKQNIFHNEYFLCARRGSTRDSQAEKSRMRATKMS